jgi:hypothetical protein
MRVTEGRMSTGESMKQPKIPAQQFQNAFMLRKATQQGASGAADALTKLG